MTLRAFALIALAASAITLSASAAAARPRESTAAPNTETGAAEAARENRFKDAAAAWLDDKSAHARVVQIDFTANDWKSE